VLARIMPPGAVGVLGPTYTGHAEAFAAVGARVVQSKWLEDLADFKVAIVANPNNPDGRIESRHALLELHERLDRSGGILIVDEAFADFDGAEESLAPVLPAFGAVVLRSFGKSFGLAGLRLGFAIASLDIGEQLRATLGPWPVSGPAIAIGTRALTDLVWADAMGARLSQDVVRLDVLLAGHGWRIAGGTRLFRLATKTDAEAGFRRLLAAGILTRPFAGAPDRLRIGIPGEEAHWDRLAAALQS
jgi:cobalamin biosynthesis protein CobC